MPNRNALRRRGKRKKLGYNMEIQRAQPFLFAVLRVAIQSAMKKPHR